MDLSSNALGRAGFDAFSAGIRSQVRAANLDSVAFSLFWLFLWKKSAEQQVYGTSELPHRLCMYRWEVAPLASQREPCFSLEEPPGVPPHPAVELNLHPPLKNSTGSVLSIGVFLSAELPSRLRSRCSTTVSLSRPPLHPKNRFHFQVLGWMFGGARHSQQLTVLQPGAVMMRTRMRSKSAFKG